MRAFFWNPLDGEKIKAPFNWTFLLKKVNALSRCTCVMHVSFTVGCVGNLHVIFLFPNIVTRRVLTNKGRGREDGVTKIRDTPLKRKF